MKQFFKDDVDRSRAGVPFFGQIREPTFLGDFHPDLGQTVHKRLAEVVRRVVGRNQST